MEAKLAIRIGRYAHAEKVLGNMFQRHPGNIEGHCLLGEVYLLRRNYKEALQEFSKTTIVNETYRPGWEGKARVFRALGNLQEEYDALAKLLESGVADASIYLRLGELEGQLGLPTSLDHFRKVAELAPESTMAAEARYYIFHASHQEAA